MLAVGPAGPLLVAMFWLKKFVSFWLMPLPFCLTLLIVGLILLHRPRRTALGRKLLVLGVALLALFGNKLVSTWLVRPIEATFPPVPDLVAGAPLPAELARCRYIVVLGSGHGDTPGFAANHRLSTAALGRIVEGVRLARALPEARLIVSGGGEPGRPTHAVVLGQVATMLGVAPERIVRIESGRDTEEEAAAVRALVGPAPVALVTTAWHLPRAAALFRRAGVDILPCPTDYTARSGPETNWSDFDWDVPSLERSTAAVRERIGYLWVWLRGKV